MRREEKKFCQAVLSKLRLQQPFRAMMADWNEIPFVCLRTIDEMRPYLSASEITQKLKRIGELYCERVCYPGRPYDPTTRLALFLNEISEELLLIPQFRTFLAGLLFGRPGDFDELVLKGVVLRRIAQPETLQVVTQSPQHYFAQELRRSQGFSVIGAPEGPENSFTDRRSDK